MTCPVCGYPSLPTRGEYKICGVCQWEDDGTDTDTPDRPSDANQGYTLRLARANFETFGLMYAEGDHWMPEEYLAPVVVVARRRYVESLDDLLLGVTTERVQATRARRAEITEALIEVSQGG